MPAYFCRTATSENWQFLTKLNICLFHDPVILLLGTDPGEMKTYVPIKTCTKNVHSSCIHNSPTLETIVTCNNRSVDKQIEMCSYNRISVTFVGILGKSSSQSKLKGRLDSLGRRPGPFALLAIMAHVFNTSFVPLLVYFISSNFKYCNTSSSILLCS